MQTFLPFASFEDTAKVLDYRRLGKQRVEAWQILNCLSGKTEGWKNHPAVKMWKGYEGTLARYGLVICGEWIARGYKDKMMDRFEEYLVGNQNNPVWLGDEQFHSSHRQTLLFKNFEHYSKFGWKEIPKYEYVWPNNFSPVV